MKKSILISLLVGIMGAMILGGCKERASCDGGIQGYLHVLDKPFRTDTKFYRKNVKISAIFYDSDTHGYYITGSVPKNVSPNVLINAKISSVYPKEGEIIHEDLSYWIYKLDCIERK